MTYESALGPNIPELVDNSVFRDIDPETSFEPLGCLRIRAVGHPSVTLSKRAGFEAP